MVDTEDSKTTEGAAAGLEHGETAAMFDVHSVHLVRGMDTSSPASHCCSGVTGLLCDDSQKQARSAVAVLVGVVGAGRYCPA